VYAIGLLPLATVFAIEFHHAGVDRVLAALLLGERLNQGRIVYAGPGLTGIAIILKPGFGPVQPAALVIACGLAGVRHDHDRHQSGSPGMTRCSPSCSTCRRSRSRWACSPRCPDGLRPGKRRAAVGYRDRRYRQ